MRNRKRSAGTLVVAASLTAVATLGGCGSAATNDKSTSEAKVLSSMRADYVGDNSRVAALVREVFPTSDFGYSLRLETAARPFTVTIRIDRSTKPVQHLDFSQQATLLLGLIANVDAVTVVSADSHYALTTAVATKRLGYDVKELGRSQSRLQTYIDAQNHD